MTEASNTRAWFARAALVSTLVAGVLAACGGGGMGGSSSGGGMCGGYLQPACGGNGGGGGFGGAGGGQYIANGLVSDTGSGALHADANLVNGWGLAFNPSGFAWVSDEGTGKSTLYDGNGVAQSTIVSFQPGIEFASNPTGLVYNGTSDFDFSVGMNSGAPLFIFATLQGQIESWSPAVSTSQAYIVVDNGTVGAVYTGLAIGADAGADRLYAAKFLAAGGGVDVFDGNYQAVAGGFVDPTLPAGYAPYGIQAIGANVYVTYAQPGADGRATKGAGLGLVDVYDEHGNFVKRLVGTGGALNAPWGVAMAPANFGPWSNMLLVGNFGDGKINAFDPNTGALAGTVSNDDGSPIVVDGLWGIAFGNGINSQPTNTLFYTAGPASETHGLYGRIDLN
jgi:uncharacterized protein (TIGR03118 family)